MDYEAVINKIIAILKADAELVEPSKIRKYLFGEPATKWEVWPIVWVSLLRDDQEYASVSRKMRHFMQFEIVVINQDVSEEKCDKAVLAKAKRIEEVLAANPTLDNLVRESWITSKEMWVGAIPNYAVSGVRQVLRCEQVE